MQIMQITGNFITGIHPSSLVLFLGVLITGALEPTIIVVLILGFRWTSEVLTGLLWSSPSGEVHSF